MERNGIIHKTTKEGLAFSVQLIKRDTSDVATQLFASVISFRRFRSKVSPHIQMIETVWIWAVLVKSCTSLYLEGIGLGLRCYVLCFIPIVSLLQAKKE
jgi:hypothetical protein